MSGGKPGILPCLLIAAALCGCDRLGLDDPAKAAAAREAEGKAIGAGCRHSGHALEDCYAENAKISKAAIYAGWRDMDAYMRENKIDIVAPQPAVSDRPSSAAPARSAVPANSPAGGS